MSAYKLIAIDLDGTLLGPDGKVSERNRLAVQRAMEAGFLVVVATGRNYYESVHILDEIGHQGHAVFVGGAHIVDTAEGETIHRQGMDPQLAADVCRRMIAGGLHPMALQDRDATGIDYLLGPEPLEEKAQEWHNRVGSRLEQVPNLAEADHTHTTRVGAVDLVGKCDAVAIELEQAYGERLYVQKIDLANLGMEVVEVFDPSVNKWTGIQHVARHHDIRPKEIVAIGDDRNDLHMLKEAGLGVAMGNAKPEVKAIADRVIGTHHEDGLAAFLDELVAARGEARRHK